MSSRVPQIPASKGVPSAGIGLCLSGGGYRAMLFHTGALWRLNELGFLPKLDRVSSVSGGSLTAAALAAGWQRLDFSGPVASNFVEEVVAPVSRLASRTIDLPAVARGILRRGSIGNWIAAEYRTSLVGDRTLQDLPERPLFLFLATSLQTGNQVLFSRRGIGWFLGSASAPKLPLAEAVAASAASPPFLSPVVVKTDEASLRVSAVTPPDSVLAKRMVLTDGGVIDNLGVDPVWNVCRTILISDAGARVRTVSRPAKNWAGQIVRVFGILTPQAPAMRKRRAVEAFAAADRLGAYWSIRSLLDDFPVKDPLPHPWERVIALSDVRTRLAAMDGDLRKRLINWGYAVCDAAVRSHVASDATPPDGFPYPDAAE